MLRRGQAMIETLLAVVLLTSLFFALFKLSRLFATKIMVQHAAMRVARARAVGLNEFQCLKTARVAVIPVAGKRLNPGPDDERKDISEAAMARVYMRTPDLSYANGLLIYEGWDPNILEVPPRSGSAETTIRMKSEWSIVGDMTTVEGEAIVDHFPDYLNDEGL